MRLSVTGHRPDKLGGYGDGVYRRLRELATEELVWLKPSYVLTGMALGWDQAVADACVDLSIPFEACVPFKGQESIWPQGSQIRYQELLCQAERVTYVCDPGFHYTKMLRRNEYLVDNCDQLLALWNGTKGGTKHCVDYAKRKRQKVHNCWESWDRPLLPLKESPPKSTEWMGSAEVTRSDECPF